MAFAPNVTDDRWDGSVIKGVSLNGAIPDTSLGRDNCAVTDLQRGRGISLAFATGYRQKPVGRVSPRGRPDGNQFCSNRLPAIKTKAPKFRMVCGHGSSDHGVAHDARHAVGPQFRCRGFMIMATHDLHASRDFS